MDGPSPPLWPADKVDRRPLSSLTPYAQNARTHSPRQVAQIAKSMQEFGWTNPVLVDEAGMIIAGHGRVLAAAELGFIEAPVMVAAGWTEVQKRAYVLADNQLALNAGWDSAMLADELAALSGAGFDMDLLGFDNIDALLAGGGRRQPNDTPELPTVAATRTGDVWLLGRHRLVCGDATSAETVKAALAGARPHLMVTDPPYGVSYDADWRNKAGVRSGAAMAIGKVMNDDRADWSEAWALFPGDVAYVWHGALRGSEVAGHLVASGFVIRSQIIWAKHHHLIGRGDYHWRHEPCWYAVRKGRTGHWQGDRTQNTVWVIDAHIGWRSQTDGPDQATQIHSTQKPVECMRRPMENNSKVGETVYDPFMGSGTSLISAEMSGRASIGIEISPIYVDVAVTRWQNYTGHEATLMAGGTFAEVSAERIPVPAA